MHVSRTYFSSSPPSCGNQALRLGTTPASRRRRPGPANSSLAPPDGAETRRNQAGLVRAGAHLMAVGRPRWTTWWTTLLSGRWNGSRRVPMVGVGGADDHKSARCGAPHLLVARQPRSRGQATRARLTPGAGRGREYWFEMVVKPIVAPFRQKSAFLPEHPDNRRISTHIGLSRRRIPIAAKSLVMRDVGGRRVTSGVNRTQEVGGSNPPSSTLPPPASGGTSLSRGKTEPSAGGGSGPRHQESSLARIEDWTPPVSVQANLGTRSRAVLV
jgi:hypothetical protein